MQYKNVLVTGGLGFIGSAVSEALLDEGARVTVVDSGVSNVIEPAALLSSYATVRVERTTAEEFLARPDALSGIDLVIHAASLVGPAGILRHASHVGSSIVESTSRAIDACMARDLPLVYFSSAEVYGKSGLLSEDADIRVPAQPNVRIEYALGKLTSEAMIANARTQGLRAVIIRPFNVVGPRQSSAGGFVMPSFVQQALANQAVTVFESGSQQRAFMAVGDLVRFIVEHLERALQSSQHVFNVGNPNNVTSVVALAHRIIQLLRSRSHIVFTDGKQVYGPLYCEAESFVKTPVIEAAQRLGWAPRKTLDEIILETAAYFRPHADFRADSTPAIAV